MKIKYNYGKSEILFTNMKIYGKNNLKILKLVLSLYI